MMAAVTAAVAGLSAAGAATGGQPWSGSISSMPVAAHTTADTGASSFGPVLGSNPGATQQAASQGGAQAGHAQLADRQQPAASGTAQPKQASSGPATLGILQALHPLPAQHTAPVQHPGAQHPVAQHPAPASKPAVAKPAPPASPVTASPVTVKPVTAKPVAAKAKPAPPKPAPRHTAPPPPAKPYTIYDSVTPTAIPSHQQVIATYSNGHYQASWSDVRGRHDVLWIDTNGDNPGARVLDVEPGDATPSGAAQWAKDRLASRPNSVAIIYTMRSEWGAVQDAIGTLPSDMQSHVRYWIADPTGVPHVVPGSSATQWYWGSNYDITTALPQFEH